MANDPGRRSLVEADEPSAAILFQHTVLCQTSLPYRDPGPNRREWERVNGAVRLKILAGEALHPENYEWVQLGLPFGPKPRLILAHLNREALLRGSPEIEVEASLTAFAKRLLRYDPNGHEIRLLKEQLARLSASIMRLGVARDEGRASTINLPLIECFDLWFPKNERQRVLWPTTVRLSPTYFESLQRHAVPLDEVALAALAHSSMGLDVYAWLAQRLHRVDPGRPQLVSWAALKEQFGSEYERIRKFREVFKQTLPMVQGQYRGARLRLDERGMVLHHSPPPISGRYAVIRNP